MTQDTFNKVITATLFAFFMAMYIVSFITGKAVDWNQLLVFIVPTLNHIVHQYTSAQVQTTNINATSRKDVAQITANGTNGAGAAPRG